MLESTRRNMSARSVLARHTSAAIVAAVALASGCSSTRPSDVLEARTYIEADYGTVWNRFTRAAEYEDWYSSPCLEFGDRPGDDVRWGTTERLVYQGTLEEIRPGSGLTHTFQFVGFGFDEPPTRVEIDIVEQGETVLITIRHDCADAPQTRAMISPVGWAKSLARLKTLLETGEAMPWPQDR